MANNIKSEYDVSGGNNTKDKVFLLSYDEVNTYFSDLNSRICYRWNDADESNPTSWWLRSPGNEQKRTMRVIYNGEIWNDGIEVTQEGTGVRPVIWVTIDS